MKFDPSAAKEPTRFEVFRPGWYDAVVVECDERKSKAGNDMLALRVKVFDNGSNRTSHVRDWIVISGDKAGFGLGKLKKLCAALDLDFEAGDIDLADIEGGNIRVRLDIENNDDKWGDTNRIRAYAADPEFSKSDVSADSAEETPF